MVLVVLRYLLSKTGCKEPRCAPLRMYTRVHRAALVKRNERWL